VTGWARVLLAAAAAALACGDDLGPRRDAGSCPRAEDCAPYACGPAGSCLESCSSADQCAAEHVCQDAACVGTECTPESAREVCGPYACLNGDCAADCALAPCADGYYCRGNDNECVPRCTERDDPVCEGYVCNVEFGECETICDDQFPCADGFTCDPNGHCQPDQSSSSA
jgi:hypothetical protein